MRRRLAHDHFDHGRFAKVAARRQGIGNVVFEVVLRVEHSGDAALGDVAVRLPQAALGDHEHRLAGGHGQRRRSPASPPPITSTSVKRCGVRLGSNGTR